MQILSVPRREFTTASRGTLTRRVPRRREPPHVGDHFRPHIPQHQYQRVQPYPVRAKFCIHRGAHAQRSAQGEAPYTVKQLRAAHPRLARGQQRGDRRRLGFGGATARQREGNEFEAVGHAWEKEFRSSRSSRKAAGTATAQRTCSWCPGGCPPCSVLA